MMSLFFQTSASLKFTVLNPKGRIWTMVAGGGASVIYADTVSFEFLPCFNLAVQGFHATVMKLSFFFLIYQVGDLGYASELGNYAEYSGAPNEEEVLQYARVVLDVSTQDITITTFLSTPLLCQFVNDNIQCSVRLLILMAARELFSLEGV